jgi:hypothetical protein
MQCPSLHAALLKPSGLYYIIPRPFLSVGGRGWRNRPQKEIVRMHWLRMSRNYVPAYDSGAFNINVLMAWDATKLVHPFTMSVHHITVVVEGKSVLGCSNINNR